MKYAVHKPTCRWAVTRNSADCNCDPYIAASAVEARAKADPSEYAGLDADIQQDREPIWSPRAALRTAQCAARRGRR